MRAPIVVANLCWAEDRATAEITVQAFASGLSTQSLEQLLAICWWWLQEMTCGNSGRHGSSRHVAIALRCSAHGPSPLTTQETKPIFSKNWSWCNHMPASARQFDQHYLLCKEPASVCFSFGHPDAPTFFYPIQKLIKPLSLLRPALEHQPLPQAEKSSNHPPLHECSAMLTYVQVNEVSCVHLGGFSSKHFRPLTDSQNHLLASWSNTWIMQLATNLMARTLHPGVRTAMDVRLQITSTRKL